MLISLNVFRFQQHSSFISSHLSEKDLFAMYLYWPQKKKTTNVSFQLKIKPFELHMWHISVHSPVQKNAQILQKRTNKTEFILCHSNCIDKLSIQRRYNYGGKIVTAVSFNIQTISELLSQLIYCFFFNNIEKSGYICAHGFWSSWKPEVAKSLFIF